jgi:hypothetical protein
MAQEAHDAGASAPEPRAALGDALAARAEAATALGALEAAATAAVTALSAAQSRHDAAVAAVADAERTAVARAAAALTGGPIPASAMTSGAARGNLRTAEDALAAARGARALLDDQAMDARRNLTNAAAAVRSAALRVLAAEEFEDTLTAAVEARADYVEAVGSLAWLIRSHAIASDDARARQLVAGADVAPSAWPEATTAGARLEARFAALMEGTP